MYFRVTCAVDDLTDNMCDEPIAYDLAGPSVIHFVVSKQKPTTETPKGGPVMASCATGVEFDESEGLRDLTSAIAASKDGLHVYLGDMQERVKGIYAIVDPVFAQLGRQLETSLTLLRWRYGITDGPIRSVSNRSEAVSVDGSTWRNISGLRSVKLVFTILRKIDKSVIEEVSQLHNQGAEPPLGLQLLIEAQNQRTTHPRSALVIGVMAAEIALKQLIGELAPDARWLAERVQSPPIDEIAREYIPSLKVKAKFTGKTLKPPKELLKKLEAAIKARNRVVHRGAAPPKPDELQEVLATMEDIVWMCSLYSGHRWAGNYVSHGTISAWENGK